MRPTFFHHMVTHNRRKAIMASFTLPDSSSSDQNIIHVIVIDVFHKQLTSQPGYDNFSLYNIIPSLLIEGDNNLLLKPSSFKKS